MEQIAEEHDEGFKQLLGAYSQLAKQLAFVDQLSALVRTSECFKRIPADICGDVLEFHSETYGLFRRGGWTELFQASWKHFTPQLNCILQRLNEYSDLMQRFTTTLGSKSYGPITMEGYSTLHQGDQYNTNIVAQIPPESLSSMHKHWTEARDLRQRLTQDLEKRDAERQARQLRDTITWLQLLDQDQEQEAAFSRRADYREDGTCEWVLENTDFTNWLDLDHRHKYLWLKGKPGSGMMLYKKRAENVARKLMSFVQEKQQLQHSSSRKLCSHQIHSFYIAYARRLSIYHHPSSALWFSACS